VILDLLGQGTFGQVVKCEDLQNERQQVAVKVVKNKPNYKRQAKIEITILEKVKYCIEKS
jgi:dual specificity protein kinase YAK1